MALKLAALIIALGATACGLLVLRQQELDVQAARTELRRGLARNQQLLQQLSWELNTLSRDERLLEWARRHSPDLEPIDVEDPRNDDRRPRLANESVSTEVTRGG